jgi:hypothetical protein
MTDRSETPYVVAVAGEGGTAAEAWLADRTDAGDPPLGDDRVRTVARRVADLGGSLAWYAPVFQYLGVDLPGDDATAVEELEASPAVERVQRERQQQSLDGLAYDSATVEIEPGPEMREAVEEMKRAAEELGVSLSDRPPVAVVDSGVDDANPGITNLVGRRNYTTAETADDLCHGTVVALLLELQGGPYLDFKVGSAAGLTEGAVLCALNDVAVEEVPVVNLSLGFRPVADGEPCLTCAATGTLATEWGVLVTAASGNHGSFFNPLPDPWCPARSEHTLSVGAATREDGVADHSAQAEIYAPDGIGIRER